MINAAPMGCPIVVSAGIMELVALAMILAPIALLIGTLSFLVFLRRKNCRVCLYGAESIRAAGQICCYGGRDVTPTLTDRVSRR